MPRKKQPKIKTADDVMLTPSLAKAKPTPRSLAAHHYQRKLASHFAPHLLPRLFQSILQGCEDGNVHMVRIGAEIYELVQSDKKVSIINLDNRSVNVDARGEVVGSSGAERRDFESVIRMLNETREKRITEGNPLANRTLDITDFAPTPEGVSK